MKLKLNLNEIKSKLISGYTYEEVAEEAGCSRQYIHQLKRKYFPEMTKADFGIGKRKVLARAKQQLQWGRDLWFLTDLERACHLKFFRKRQNSKNQGYEWNIELEDIHFPTHCPVLGIELNYFTEATQENSPSFDRFDSSKGYVKGNVHIISWRANRIKNNGTAEEHRKIADYIDKMLNVSHG